MKTIVWLALCSLFVGVVTTRAQSITPIAECSTEEQQQAEMLMRDTVDELQLVVDEYFTLDRGAELATLRSERMALFLRIEELQTRWWNSVVPQLPDCSEAIMTSMQLGRIIDELLISSSMLQVVLQTNVSQFDTLQLLLDRAQERNARLRDAVAEAEPLGIALHIETPTPEPVILVTVIVRVTNTPDPNATVPVRIVTATPEPSAVENVSLPTTDNQASIMSESHAATATALPESCIMYVLREGDTPFAVAEMYDADPFHLLEVNGLDENASSLLQVGDVLIVPLDGCPLGYPSTATEVVPSGTPEPTIRPTITLAPTASNAVIRIVEVLNVSDVTAEAVTIRNTGQITNIANWTLSDDDGNTYTFSEQRLFTNAQITLYSRIGTNSPVALYWGRDEAVFEPGDVITLRDAAGGVQATYRVPE